MSLPKVQVIVDQYKVLEEAQKWGRKVDSDLTAKTLDQLSNFLGYVIEPTAIIEEDDQEGITAFQRINYRLYRVNGNREQEIHLIVNKMVDRLKLDQPDYLITVTNDQAFYPLLREALAHNIDLRVLVPGYDIPPLFSDPRHKARLIGDIVPEPKLAVFDIRVDYENIFIGLERNGWSVSPKELIEAITTKAAEFGDIRRSVVAYADWDLISNNSKHNHQRELSLIRGVDTVYQANEKGKNSADMRIATDIHKSVEENAANAPDVIILCTGDRDFRPVVEAAKERGKSLIIFTVRGTLSQELEGAADQVVYIEDLLPDQAKVQLVEDRLPRPTDPHAGLIMKFLAFLREHNWSYAYPNRAREVLGESAEQQLHQAAASKVLTAQGNKFSPNFQHPLVQASTHLLQWVPWRLQIARERRNFAEVYASHLFKEMSRDRKLTEWKIGVDWDEAAVWLDLVASTGLIVKGTQPHPYKAGEQITAWSLPGDKNPTSVSNPENAPEPEITPCNNTTPVPVKEENSDSPSHSVSELQNHKELAYHHRRLQMLREKVAAQGLNADPSLTIEIEDLEAKIQELEHRQ